MRVVVGGARTTFTPIPTLGTTPHLVLLTEPGVGLGELVLGDRLIEEGLLVGLCPSVPRRGSGHAS